MKSDCAYPGCHAPVDLVGELCAKHEGVIGVGVGLPGSADRTGDVVHHPELVDAGPDLADWPGAIRLSEVLNLCADAIDRLDPRHERAGPAALRLLFDALQPWLTGQPELMPKVVRLPSGARQRDFALAALRVDDRTFFAAGELVRILVPFLIDVFFAVTDPRTPLRAEKVLAELGSEWTKIKRTWVHLKEDEGVVFAAVNQLTWKPARDADGQHTMVRRGATTREVQDLLVNGPLRGNTVFAAEGWTDDAVAAMLQRLEDRQILREDTGAWFIVF